MLLHLRTTAMPLTQIAQLTALVATDPDGVPERLDLLRRHRQSVQQQITAWTTSLTVIDGKIDDYAGRLKPETPGPPTV